MILNNLFYITTKVLFKFKFILNTILLYYWIFIRFFQYSDSHTREIEEIWGCLCQFWPNNLKVILRYLVIISGMAPNELLQYVRQQIMNHIHLIFLILFKLLSGKAGCIIFGTCLPKSITWWAHDRITNRWNTQLFDWTNWNSTILSFNQHA